MTRSRIKSRSRKIKRRSRVRSRVRRTRTRRTRTRRTRTRRRRRTRNRRRSKKYKGGSAEAGASMDIEGSSRPRGRGMTGSRQKRAPYTSKDSGTKSWRIAMRGQVRGISKPDWHRQTGDRTRDTVRVGKEEFEEWRAGTAGSVPSWFPSGEAWNREVGGIEGGDCSGCGSWAPRSAFSKNQWAKGKGGRCQECVEKGAGLKTGRKPRKLRLHQKSEARARDTLLSSAMTRVSLAPNLDAQPVDEREGGG